MQLKKNVLEGRRILVTGGTGSMGKVLVRRILAGELGTPRKVMVLSRDEAKHHDMRLAYMEKRVTTDEVIYRNFVNTLEFRLGDVRDYSTVASAVRSADVVINAAALKQVPNCEYFPEQAVLTNCIGPSNIVRAIREGGLPVETVVGISTDKACKPINVMGMTKAIHERIFTSANVLNPDTRFICTRYGNVMASRGSVIPLFHDQILHGGPVTITAPEMTRFLMTLEEAVDCVFAALTDANRGETYIPRAPATTVLNLAKALIGGRDIEIKQVGVRPGEKMHEALLSDEESEFTEQRGDFYAIRPKLPELHEDRPWRRVLTGEFSSKDNVLNVEQTTALLRKHRLLVGMAKEIGGVELFERAAA
ncbi:MAG: polysaccharide biosynthesis protein [Rubripirellula sp.]